MIDAEFADRIDSMKEMIGESAAQRRQVFTDAAILNAAVNAVGQIYVAEAITASGKSLCDHIEACRMTYAAPPGGIIPTKI